MTKTLRTHLACGVAALALAGPAAAQETEAKVVHWWTSGSEAASLRVLADAYEAAGGTWTDMAVPDWDSALAAGTTAILNGAPPTALLFNAGTQFQDLAQQGYLADLTGYAEADGWLAQLPPSLADAITYEDRVYALPIDVQSESWVFTSKAAFETAGVTWPETWDDFFPTLDKLRAAGIIPIAHGGEAWQELELFYTFMMMRGDADLYRALFVEGDEEILTTPEFRAFAEDFKRLTDYIDPGAPGRKWNDATAMVVSGEAAIQFQGDWAKSEFMNSGLTPGKEFDCFLGVGGSDHYVMISDVIVLPEGDGLAPAQELMSSVLMQPEVQIEFNRVKGGLPARTDAVDAEADHCTQKAQQVLSDPSRLLAGPEISMSADRYGTVTDAISQYWNVPSMSADDFIESLQQALRYTD